MSPAAAPARARVVEAPVAPQPALPKPAPPLPIPSFSRILLALPFLPLLFLALMPTVYNHLRAASTLMVIADMPESAMTDFDTNPVIEEEITFPSTVTERARIYHPAGIAHPSAVVVVPGVHHLGMNEPRLERFARALSSHGYLVLTPQIDDLADYNITRSSADVISDAVHELVRRSGAPKVGLLGLSFAGGMSLIAASDPMVGRQLSGVIAIGAHDDLNRVLNFFETDETEAPDGTVLKMKAHEYGSLVTAYSHASSFFARRDVPEARTALRTLLWEDLPTAHAEAEKLSPRGRRRMAQLFAHDTKSLVPDTRRALAKAQPELEAASPHHYLAKVHVPVLLLHGSEDNVVPPTETLWLERDLPKGVLKAALISPAIGHVEVGGAGLMDKVRLIHWMKQMLDLLDTSSAQHG
jgi:pimeloyl-ACP methyl ester carboxylesterase